MHDHANLQSGPARNSSGRWGRVLRGLGIGTLVSFVAASFLAASPAVAEEVRRLIPFSKLTNLAVPATYQFRYSLWTAPAAGTGVEVWSERTKARRLTSRTVKQNLGSVNSLVTPVGYPPVDIDQQLFVQMEYRRGTLGAFTRLGGRTPLAAAAYSLWSASVADEAVPASGLSAAGSTEGQLLASVGGRVQWQDPEDGGGAVTSVAAGTGVTVSPATGAVVVGLDTAYTDARYLPATGGTLSGGLTAPTLSSTVASGTAPLTVASTTLVANLNADLLDGLDSTEFAPAAHEHDSDYVNAAGDTMTGSLTINNAGGTDLLLTESGLHAGSGFSLDIGNPAGPSLLSIFNVDIAQVANVSIEGALATGGSLGVGVAAPTTDRLIDTASGAYLTTGGAWTSTSDRGRKEAFAPVDPRAVLAKLVALPVTTWKYRNEAASIRHLGPVAQDFRAAFGLGYDEKSIAGIDADGVAFAAIQGLAALVGEQRAQIEALKARLAEQQALVLQLLAAAGRPAPAALAAR